MTGTTEASANLLSEVVKFLFTGHNSFADKVSSKAGSISNAAKEMVQNTGVVYEKSEETTSNKATYSINKMSEEDRTVLVKQLKAENIQWMQQLKPRHKRIFRRMVIGALSRQQEHGDEIYQKSVMILMKL